MKKYSTRCFRCTRTNLVWYHPEDPELKRRVSQITGVREPGGPIVSLLIVALIASAVSGAVYVYQYDVLTPKPTAVAGTGASVPK
jgi:hypothetical protein